ncbi:MAG: SDR family oxidoreductase [Alphaproteobacteria bacterium]|nr:SDR family oxidoreductase [Alphaproteobacteria bacterium]
MHGRLSGKVALITGGTSGIGEATVELFVKEGARVVFTGRNADKGRTMQASLGENARFFQADVSDEKQIKASIDKTVEAFGRLDVLFNNAGGSTRGDVDNVTHENFVHATTLLIGSVVFGIRYAAPVMKAQGGGAIINNASVSSNRTHMGEYLYSICKAGVVQATKMAGMELGRHGVSVNCISPGAIATPIFFGGSEKAAAMEPGKADAKLAKLTRNLSKATPLRRSGLPHDIAVAALFLASDEGRYINCHDLVVDGGMTAGGRVNFE